VIVQTTQLRDPAATGDPDEALSTRLRDLALVEIDALTAGLPSVDAQTLIAAFADDVADALREAKARIAALRQALAGPDPLNVVDLQPRQRASDAGQAGLDRVRSRLISQAEAGRALARLAELASGLVSKLFEADRRR
jgi:transglutaminase-like putative cysteine protease